MIAKKTRLPLLALAVALFFFILYYSGSARETWRQLPQHVGLGDHTDDSKSQFPGASATDPEYVNWNPKPEFKGGSPMPAGHNYTSVMVLARTKKEDVGWLEKELPDQAKAIYVADDPTAPLHPPKNKGHEVMVYLSYIIDNYDNLPDVSIFMHAHRLAWHNDDILGYDAGQLVKRLSRPRVWREGFVNMRCSWYPGCPDWMHPGETKENVYKQEEVLLAKSWSELFPLDKVPSVLAQPCCAQFALSRERIQALPQAQYIWYRNWLFNTKLPDSLSGRVWEYIWQFVFTGSNMYCPKEHICFCDQFGSCFGGEEEFEAFMKIKRELGDREQDLREWEDKKKAIEEAKKEGRFDEAEQLEKPEPGADEKAKKEIDRLRPIVDRLKDEAKKRGDDPRNRAKEAGREWHEGDGY
jgi:hypothetical protein